MSVAEDELFSWVQSLAGLGVWSWDVKQDVVTWSDGLYALYGLARDEFGASFEGYLTRVHPEDRERVAAAVQAALRERAGFRLVERIIRPTGAVRVLESVGTVTVDEEGAPVRMVGVCVDVTERRLLQERLAAAERFASIARLAQGVAHELNNPLHAVRTGIEQLSERIVADGTPSRDVESILEDVREGALRMTEVLRDLSSQTSDADGTSVVALDAIVRGAVTMAGPELRARARVEVEVQSGLLVGGGGTRLGQVLLHLLDNAARALPTGDPARHLVRVSAVRRANRAEVRIVDSGVGLPEDREQLFDAFVSTREIGEGRGLGLFFARQVISELGGTIELKTPCSGKGAEVIVHLPLAAGPARLEPSPARQPTTRVLIIDDDPLVRRSLQRILRSFATVAVGSGREALTLFETDRQFDLVLCDIMMPGVSGQAVYEETNARWPDLAAQFCFITGGTFNDAAAEFLQSMSDRVLYKPIESRHLLALLERRNEVVDGRSGASMRDSRP